MKKKPSGPRPFFDDYLAVLLTLASHAIADEFHPTIAKHGLSILEWRVLASLEHGKPVTTSRLAQLTLTKKPTVTRLLDRLEAEGHVVRKSDPDDRRITLVQATVKGVEAIKNLVVLAREHERGMVEGLTFDVETMKEQLREIIRKRYARVPPSDEAPIAANPMRRLRTSSAA